jgi:hypothetical protein
MLVNQNNDNNHVKFISYDGKHPCLCMGTLILEINGTKHSFGNKGKFPEFWSSGGTCGFTGDWEANVTDGEWIINVDEIPEQFRQYTNEIDEVFNDNVTYGCCGGCI